MMICDMMIMNKVCKHGSIHYIAIFSNNEDIKDIHNCRHNNPYITNGLLIINQAKILDSFQLVIPLTIHLDTITKIKLIEHENAVWSHYI